MNLKRESYSVHTREKFLYDIGILWIWILAKMRNETTKKTPTSSMAPSILKLPNPDWSRTGSNLSTYIWASWVGPVFVVREKTGGLSCAKRIPAKESHAAVSWRCAARHTSSKRGPAGSEIRVASGGREVIDLNKSLNAYNVVNIVNSTFNVWNRL